MALYDIVSQQCFESVQAFLDANNPFAEIHNFSYNTHFTESINTTMKISYLQWTDLNACLTVKTFSNDYNKYDAPMPLIGIYMACSVFWCIISILLDLKHGLLTRQFWFPCKHFSPTGVTLILIGNAVKVSTDMTSPMPGFVDQAAKLGSSAQLFVVLANFLPSFSCMVKKNLVSNILGLSFFIIVVVINICIQITTNVIQNLKKDSYHVDRSLPKGSPLINDGTVVINFQTHQTIQVGFLIYFLIILMSSVISIPSMKTILESKYQGKRKRIADDQYIGTCIIENLTQNVKRYWILTKSGSPQFVMVSSPLSYACGILCLYILGSHMFLVLKVIYKHLYSDYESAYKWSMLLNFIVDTFIVVVGSIAPICRCFMALRSKSITKECLVVFKVEKYWTQRLYGWKEMRLPFLHALYLQNILLSIFIVLQNIVLVSCKMLGLIGIILIIFARLCLKCCKSLKALLFTTPLALSGDDTNEDHRNYVLHIDDKIEFPGVIVKDVSYSMNFLIEKVKQEDHNDLLRLLERSTGFEGIKMFDIEQVQPLLSVELLNSWSLPIITIMCITLALPNIETNIVERLIKAVGDGLSLIDLVEESFNNVSEYENVRMATTNAWKNLKDNKQWLGNTLERKTFNGKTTPEILKWFVDTARDIVLKIKITIDDDMMASFSHELIIANSMYRIAETVLVLNYNNNNQQLSDMELFELLFGMISDIMSACCTNIPRAMEKRCHESVVKKREANVEVAIILLGRSTQILRKLDAQELPSISPERRIFIDEWRLHFQQSIP